MVKKSIILFLGIILTICFGNSQVYANVSNPNLALNASVTYSGVEGGKNQGNWVYPQFVGEKAVDGISTTRWSADKKDNQWLIVDLGKVSSVESIVVDFHAESPSYEVLVSENGTNYESVFSINNASQGGKVRREINIKAKNIRFIKYQQNTQWLHSNGKRYGSSIYEIKVYSNASKNQEMSTMLENRRKILVGEKTTATTVLSIIKQKDDELSNTDKTGIWNRMITNNTNVLWQDKSDWKTNSANLKLMTDNILKMAIQYQTENSRYYKDVKLKEAILYSLDWYYQNAYNEKIKRRYGNWFHWEVSIPKNLVNIYVLMLDELGQNEKSKYIATIDYFIPNPAKRLSGGRETGANLLDKCFVVLLRSLLDQNEEKYQTAMTSSLPAFEYVRSGDGFYQDGSFIQHNNVPYTGGYGAEVLGRISEIIALFQNTNSLKNYAQYYRVFDFIDKSYKPTLINSQSMSLTRGRRPSREATDDFTEGRDILFYIYLSNLVQSDNQKKLDTLWFLKSQIKSTHLGEEYFKGWDISKIQAFKKLLEDTSVSDEKYSYLGNQNMGMMTQMFHHTKNFSSAVSLFSKKTTSFEYINGENKQGFYTGTGVYYLYNSDYRHYLDGYWGSVDMARLPGTTTDGKFGKLVNDGSWLNTKSWSGGVTHNNVGSASLHYTLDNVTGSDIEAKKSWFMLEDKIIQLGTAISSTNTLSNVESIIENRKVTNFTKARLIVDGQEVKFGENKTFSNPSWAYIDTGEVSSSIGYVFAPNLGTIKAEYLLQSKNWQSVNKVNPDKMVSNKFMILSFQHGKTPVGASYQYSVHPALSLEQLMKEVKNNSYTVLKNAPEQQVMQTNDNQYFFGNFQETGTVGGITALTRGSILKETVQNQTSVSLSDPMRTNSKVVFMIPMSTESKLVSKDDNIQVEKVGKDWKISVDTSAKDGRSSTVEFTN